MNAVARDAGEFAPVVHPAVPVGLLTTLVTREADLVLLFWLKALERHDERGIACRRMFGDVAVAVRARLRHPRVMRPLEAFEHRRVMTGFAVLRVERCRRRNETSFRRGRHPTARLRRKRRYS